METPCEMRACVFALTLSATTSSHGGNWLSESGRPRHLGAQQTQPCTPRQFHSGSTPPSPESAQSEVFSQALPAQGRVSSGWRKEEGPKAGPQRLPPPHNRAASGAVALCSFCECLKPQSVP